ncbi:pyridoxal-phosphate-dependent aminotransferase [Cenarchaeum symbiosum A]|uniref:Putative [LysW]-aminoadipate semialdehyde/glutamate semialdehyde transaminase n=1 Tax=Cenarchaeum symbiosum (strain A) TaxID=414004 RepID=A0RWW2_CENSY|nr:pyridoxal-phosphate-dependent aminotransferase [Cenarchaeum symbiosum A]
MGDLYQRFPVTVAKGEGARVWDEDGKEYIDCMGGYGVALAGHRNPRVVQAIKAQLDRIITVHGSLYNKTRAEFLDRLTGAAPPGLTRVHLNNSGAESVEAAIKFAKRHTGKSGMVAMRGSYHGKTAGALSVTFNPKYKKGFGPMLEGASFSPFGDIDALRDSTGDDTALVIMEPIQGESGIRVAPPGFLQDARRLCDERGIVLIFDEIQCGLGRTGKMWAAEHWETIPDIMCLAKGIAGGIPMGATLTKPEIMASIKKGDHSSTFGGSPLACAAGSAVLQSLSEDGLVSNAETVGSRLHRGLQELQEKHRVISEVRGMGLMAGVELRCGVKDVILEGIKRGVLLLYSGSNILRLLPPLTISEDDIERVLETIDAVLNSVGRDK